MLGSAVHVYPKFVFTKLVRAASRMVVSGEPALLRVTRYFSAPTTAGHTRKIWQHGSFQIAALRADGPTDALYLSTGVL
jgi:hypothetical protein